MFKLSKSILVSIYLVFAGTVPSLNCGREVARPDQPGKAQAQLGSVMDYESLMEKLRAAGASVKPEGNVEQPFLFVRGRMIKAYGEDVQVFEYPSVKEMEAQAALISPDGRTIGRAKPYWVGEPHFFKTGKVLVLYVGENERVLKTLAAVLGRQFAGK